MGYEDKKESTGIQTPHADHLLNIAFASDFMKRDDIKRFMKDKNVSTYMEKVGPNAHGAVGSNLSAIDFQWMKGQSKFACPISFHQDSNEFISEINRFFGIKQMVYSSDKKTPSIYSAYKDS